jgi:hypothetical protein
LRVGALPERPRRALHLSTATDPIDRRRRTLTRVQRGAAQLAPFVVGEVERRSRVIEAAGIKTD